MITVYVAVNNPTQLHKRFKTITWQLLEDTARLNIIIKKLDGSSTISLVHVDTCGFGATRQASM